MDSRGQRGASVKCSDATLAGAFRLAAGAVAVTAAAMPALAATFAAARTTTAAIAAAAVTALAAFATMLVIAGTGRDRLGCGLAAEQRLQPAEEATRLGGSGDRGGRSRGTERFLAGRSALGRRPAAVAGCATPIAGRRHVLHARTNVEELRRDGGDIDLFLGGGLVATFRTFFTARTLAAVLAGRGETVAFPSLGGRGLLLGGREDVQLGGFFDDRGRLDHLRRGNGGQIGGGFAGDRGLRDGNGRFDRGGSLGGSERVGVFAGGVDDLDGGRLVVAGGGRGGGSGGAGAGTLTLTAS